MIRPRWSSLLAVSLLGAAVAMAIGWVALGFTRPHLPGIRPAEVGDVPFVTAYLVFCLAGALLAAHRRGNVIGWVLLAGGLTQIAYVFSHEYAVRALVMEAPLPAAGFAAWVAFTISPAGFVFFALLLLLFPTGRPPSRRWNWVLWTAIAAEVVMVAGAVVDFPRRGVAMLAFDASDANITSEAADTAFMIAIGTLTATALIGCAALIVRYLCGSKEQRLQLKWMAFAATVFAAVTVFDMVGVLGQGDPLLVTTLTAAGVAMIPVAALIAVTRYRLYAIDRVISRTVSYVAITTVVVALYLAAVTVLTAVTAPVTGRSPLAVAAATLVAASAFQPLRRRIQGAVDRRFNRSRYDAARAIEAYRGRLRDELDLDAIADGLVRTAESTLQPRSAVVLFASERGAA